VKALAAAGAPEGSWLRADRQTGGRGRNGRTWVSPPGNLYASTIVRLRPGDPPAPTLALVAGVALFEAVRPSAGEGLRLKWPNDLLAGHRKLGGILLERVDHVVVVGIGINLAHHPDDADRPATSLASEGWPHPPADAMLTDLAYRLAEALAEWRNHGLAPVRRAWIAAAHPIGTPLATHGPDGSALAGTFDGLDHDGACRLRLADGGVRLIHAGDVFLV
jgi:BirA family biotin operon repressor/biotin-[acetyl-CoA-carboxylase] ligase